MERMINEQPADKVIDAAISDAIVRLRKMTNNHPSLGAGTPFRKSTVKTMRNHLAGKDRTGNPDYRVSVGGVAYSVAFENFRVVSVSRVAERAAEDA